MITEFRPEYGNQEKYFEILKWALQSSLPPSLHLQVLWLNLLLLPLFGNHYSLWNGTFFTTFASKDVIFSTWSLCVVFCYEGSLESSWPDTEGVTTQTWNIITALSRSSRRLALKMAHARYTIFMHSLQTVGTPPVVKLKMEKVEDDYSKSSALLVHILGLTEDCFHHFAHWGNTSSFFLPLSSFSTWWQGTPTVCKGRVKTI